MKIKNLGYSIELSEKELSVVMASLRLAAQHHGQISSGANPFFDLHGEFVRQTGFCGGDHMDLKNKLREAGNGLV